MRYLHALVAGLVTLVVLPASPAFAAEKLLKHPREAVEALEGAPIKKVPDGKTLARYAAPDGQTTLLVRDEGEVGDFVWHALYVKRAGTYQKIGTCQEVDKVRWSADSKSLTFEMKKATDFDTITTYLARYKVGEKRIGLTALKSNKV